MSPLPPKPSGPPSDADGLLDLGSWRAAATLDWPREIDDLPSKLRIADRVATNLSDGQTVGIGSGSTAYLALWAIARQTAARSLTVTVTTTSFETQAAALTLGLPTAPLGRCRPTWAVDGADEIDPHGRLLKGRGGAFLKEKLLWATSASMVLAADPSKLVPRLGLGSPVPVEVLPDAVDMVTGSLRELGARTTELRTGSGKDGPVITESGNVIVEAAFDEVPLGLHEDIKRVTGVIETGLFEGYEFTTIDGR